MCPISCHGNMSWLSTSMGGLNGAIWNNSVSDNQNSTDNCLNSKSSLTLVEWSFKITPYKNTKTVLYFTNWLIWNSLTQILATMEKWVFHWLLRVRILWTQAYRWAHVAYIELIKKYTAHTVNIIIFKGDLKYSRKLAKYMKWHFHFAIFLCRSVDL